MIDAKKTTRCRKLVAGFSSAAKGSKPNKYLHTCNMVDAVLSRGEPMRTETTLAWEGSIGVHNALGLIIGTVQTWVYISEMLLLVSGTHCLESRFPYLGKVILPEAGLHLLRPLIRAQAAHPRLGWVALFLVPLPIALSPIPLPALPRTLIDLVRIPAEKLGFRSWCTTPLPASRGRLTGLGIMIAWDIRSCTEDLILLAHAGL